MMIQHTSIIASLLNDTTITTNAYDKFMSFLMMMNTAITLTLSIDIIVNHFINLNIK